MARLLAVMVGEEGSGFGRVLRRRRSHAETWTGAAIIDKGRDPDVDDESDST